MGEVCGWFFSSLIILSGCWGRLSERSRQAGRHQLSPNPFVLQEINWSDTTVKEITRFKLPAVPVFYEPEGMDKKALERGFDVSPKALFHVMFGDRSTLFQTLYFERRARGMFDFFLRTRNAQRTARFWLGWFLRIESRSCTASSSRFSFTLTTVANLQTRILSVYTFSIRCHLFGWG